MMSSIGPIRRNPLEFLAATWRRHGDVVQFPIPRPATYLISNPADVRSILVGARKVRASGRCSTTTLRPSRVMDCSQPMTRRGGNIAESSNLRSITASWPGWLRTPLRTLNPWLDSWRDSSTAAVMDLDEVMMEVSLQAVASALFGSDWQASASGLTKSTIIALDAVVARARNPLAPPLWLPTPGKPTPQVLDCCSRRCR